MLALLGVSHDNKRDVLHAGGLAAVLAAMRAHPRVVGVQEQVVV